jgi:hypothetical protein
MIARKHSFMEKKGYEDINLQITYIILETLSNNYKIIL